MNNDDEFNYSCPHCLFYETKKGGCAFGFRKENREEDDESTGNAVRKEHKDSGSEALS